MTDQDALSYFGVTLMNKVLESDTLHKQALGNEEAQFEASPDLMDEFQNAIIAALDVNKLMGTALLNDPAKQKAALGLMLRHFGLHTRLREREAA